MSVPRKDIPRVNLQPPSVDFIDNRLDEYHPAFKANSGVQYDPAIGRYSLTPPKTLMLESAGEQSMPPRPALPEVGKYKFWDTIFPKAMERLKEKPMLKLKSEYLIREKTSWEEVHNQLQKARELYDSDPKSHRGKVKNFVRNAMDHSSSVTPVIKIVKEIDCVSAPMAAVEILLDAFKKSSTIRQTVKETFLPEELENNFKYIETAMAAFPGDCHIHGASLQLVVSILLAIEKAIEFFTKHQCIRGAAALIKNEKYEDTLVESINIIKRNSDKLMKEVGLSDIVGSRQAMMSLVQGQTRITVQVDTLSERAESNYVSLFNKIMSLFDEANGERRKDRVYVEAKINHLEELIRERTPSPSPSPMLPGPWQHTNLPAAAQTQAAPLPWYPLPYMQYYPYYPPHSSQGPLLWHPQAMVQDRPAVSPSSQWLQEALYIPYSDEKDLARVAENKDVISLIHRDRAEQVVSAAEFRDWAIKAESKELLVEGNFEYDDCHYISALSLLCSSLTQALRTREGYITLVFFCGCHGRGDEDTHDDDGKYVGGVAMMKSMILQLLKQHHFFDLVGLEKDINLDSLKDGGDLGQLCCLFTWLIKRLPRDVILVCIIDGVVHYEIDILEDGLQKVIECLLGLSKDTKISIPVKVLVTSPTPTEMTRDLFRGEEYDDEKRMMSLDSFPEINYISSTIESDGEMNERLDAYQEDDE